MTVKQVEVNLAQLRRVTMHVFEALRLIPELREMKDEQLPMLHAYMLGVVMQAAGLNMASITGLADIVRCGYQDFLRIEKAMRDAGEPPQE